MIESLCAFARVDDLAEALELPVAVPAEPDSEDQATFAQVIERDRLAGNLCTRRRDRGVTSGPSRNRWVWVATAPSATRGSATARTGGR